MNTLNVPLKYRNDAPKQTQIMRAVKGVPNNVKVVLHGLTHCYELWHNGTRVMELGRNPAIERRFKEEARMHWRKVDRGAYKNCLKDLEEMERVAEEKSEKFKQDVHKYAGKDVYRYAILNAHSVS